MRLIFQCSRVAKPKQIQADQEVTLEFESFKDPCRPSFDIQRLDILAISSRVFRSSMASSRRANRRPCDTASASQPSHASSHEVSWLCCREKMKVPGC